MTAPARVFTALSRQQKHKVRMTASPLVFAATEQHGRRGGRTSDQATRPKQATKGSAREGSAGPGGREESAAPREARGMPPDGNARSVSEGRPATLKVRKTQPEFPLPQRRVFYGRFPTTKAQGEDKFSLLVFHGRFPTIQHTRRINSPYWFFTALPYFVAKREDDRNPTSASRTRAQKHPREQYTNYR